MKHLFMTTAALAALTLAACGPDADDDNVPDDLERAAEEGEELAREAGEELEEFAREAGERGERLLDEAREARDEDGEADADATPDADPAAASDAETGTASLDEILDDERRADDRARDEFRNPGETLDFFEVDASDTVVEALPGGGWYTRILLPFVDAEGEYYAINYPMNVFEQLFGDMDDERRASLEGWEDSFPGQASEWGGSVDGTMRFGAVPAEMEGEADVVLYIRALHNLARFGMLQTAADDAFALLEPGGIAGVVQHRAPEDETDERADGSRGYLRESDVIEAFEAAGFELEDSAEINANPNDPADHEDGVWTLPPSLGGPEDTRADMEAIGESDRMTLKFRKPE